MGTELVIDNSTNFKDFRITKKQKGQKETELNIQISQASFEDGRKGMVCLEIGNISLFGREVEMLREFLNQSL